MTAIISNSDSTTSVVTECESYIWNGQIIDSSGVYIQTMTNVEGCDSIHTMSVNIINNDQTYSSISSCTGALFMERTVD